MKLKYRIIFLPSFSSLLLIVVFSVLIFIHKAQISEKITAGDVLISLFWWALTLGLVILTLTILLAWVMAKKLTSPIVRITSIAREIADGDLSSAAESIRVLVKPESIHERHKSYDETGRLLIAFATMTENLNSLVGEVQRSGVQVTSSSSELFASAKRQETMVTHQIDSINKVCMSVEEISNIAAQLVNTMHRVASMSQETADFASSGQTGLIRMKETMYQMENASRLIFDRLEAINEKADNITAVVTTITKVAEQTNLLSLNAAIEAEKAGEYGRGFAVIAREIRRLADQTAVATLDIEHMVQVMQSAVTVGVMEMDKFIAEVRHGVKDVGRISTQLTRIIEQVQVLSPNFENVDIAMEQQSQSAQRINTAIVNLSGDMEQTMEALRESYSAIEQLNEASQNLQKEVSRFQVSFSILREIEIFQPFSAEAKSYLNQNMQGLHFSPGETIVRQGDLTNSLYIVAKGMVGIWVQLPDGKSIEVARGAPGDILGEISLLTGEARTASIITITDVYLFEIKKEDIAPFIKAEPKIAERLSAILTERKMDTEAKKNRYELKKLDKDALYKQTLHKIQQFFGLKTLLL